MSELHLSEEYSPSLSRSLPQLMVDLIATRCHMPLRHCICSKFSLLVGDRPGYTSLVAANPGHPPIPYDEIARSLAEDHATQANKKKGLEHLSQ